jgi:hypothetical protein
MNIHDPRLGTFHDVQPQKRAPRLMPKLEVFHGSFPECNVCGSSDCCDMCPERFIEMKRMCLPCYEASKTKMIDTTKTQSVDISATGDFKVHFVEPKTETRFKVGDKVRCVCQWGEQRAGDIFTVSDVEPSGHVRFEGRAELWSKERFERVSEIDTGKIEVGDTVERLKYMDDWGKVGETFVVAKMGTIHPHGICAEEASRDGGNSRFFWPVEFLRKVVK